MSFNIIILPVAEREIKRLNKRHRTFKKDFAGLVSRLQDDPSQGEPLGKDCYKIRLAIKSKQRGKSGGARVITYVHISKETVVILSVYDKTDTDTISDDDIIERLAAVDSES
jgi:mRNA-degrading endonuclease RelE of RelBE toxin-antitoxin system